MSSYTNIFGGTILQPAFVSYLSITLNSNQTLNWPSDFQNGNNVVAAIMDVSPTLSATYSLTLPNATNTSVGTLFTINNPTGNTFTLLKADSSVLATILATSINSFYLIDNTTTGGTWREVPFGGGYPAVTSVNATSLTPDITITGGPITTTGTFQFNVAQDLLALTSFGGSVGIAFRTATNTWTLGSILGTNNQIAITNPDGSTGNPTISLAANISGITSLQVGNISLSANTITAVNANGSITINSLGTGNINISPLGTGITTISSQLSIGAGQAIVFNSSVGVGFTSFASGNMGGTQVTLLWPTVAPTAGQVLSFAGGTALDWATVATVGGGTTINAIAKYISTSGSLGNSGVLIDNSNNITGAHSLIAGDLSLGVAGVNIITSVNNNENIIISPNGIGAINLTNLTNIQNGSLLSFYNIGNGNAVSLSSPPGLAATYSLLWPTAAPTANQVLQYSSANQLVWTNVGSAQGDIKAWVTFDGTSGGIKDSFNVTSVTRTGTGVYTIVFTTPFSNANFGGVFSTNAAGAGWLSTPSVSNTATVNTVNFSGVATDFNYTSAAFFGS
jgi:hypothetical protein